MYSRREPNYVGMKLGDTVIDRHNKQVTIRHACYSEIGAAFYKGSIITKEPKYLHRGNDDTANNKIKKPK